MSEALLGSELDAMVTRYLGELEDALRRLPAPQRDHLVSEIREHIFELRSERTVRDRSDMEALLNRVGLPEDIAAVALENEDAHADLDAAVGPAAATGSGPPVTRAWRTFSTRWVAAAAAVVVAGILLAAVAGGFTSSSNAVIFARPAGALVLPVPPNPPGVPADYFGIVPNVVGESQTAAEETMIGAGLPYRLQKVPSATVAAGTVVAQSPAAGGDVVRLRTVTIIISSGPAT